MRGKTMALVLGLVTTLLAVIPPATAAAADVYELAGGCYALRATDSAQFVERAEGGWRATAEQRAGGEPFRMQATALGRYLLFARDRTFVAASGSRAVAATAPGPDADWELHEAGPGGFTLTLAGENRRLAVAQDGRLVVGETAATFTFEDASDCAAYPESGVNVEGTPRRADHWFGEATGLIDTHLHGMAFEFIGGSIRCGRPWHPYGIAFALVDCPDHGPDGRAAVAENFLAYGNPAAGHNTDGWPTFEGWPHHRTYVHEQVYWKWLERAWRGGLRLYTNLLVDNAVLCRVYPLKRNPCDEMHNVRLQAQRMRELESYIDAQNGGPGKGWLRIVTDPFEARRVINDGKLAVVLGIETSIPFDCGEYNHRPECDRETIDRQLDEVHALGIRQMELVNKFDNALVGVAGDAGTTGILTNSGNREETGHFWAMETCTGPHSHEDHDHEQITNAPMGGRDELVGGILKLFLPPDTAPLYPPAPHCNAQGLTDLGAYLIRRMIDKGMVFDPDHMSVRGRDQALAMIESRDYGGVISSHSWSTPDSYRRILALGGLVTPASKRSESFVEDWKELKPWRNPRYLYGTGFSTDMNGFASQGGPRPGNQENPVVYPFTSLDGSTTVQRHHVGERVYDLNEDGTAHFGLYPDRIEDIRLVGGEEVAKDLLRGAEAYIQMWERAEGIAGPICRAAQRRFISGGLGEMRVGQDPVSLLRSAGQPEQRDGRVWTWCVRGRRGGAVKAVLTPQGRVALVASTAPIHRAAGIRRGTPVRRVEPHTRPFGPGVRVRPANRHGNRVVYGVRRGRVTFTALASRTAARTPAQLRRYLRLARLR